MLQSISTMRCSKLSVLALLLVPSIAAAHLRITSPTPRFSDGNLKKLHCGALNSPRANVQTRRPGSMMKLVWDRYVPHPGWIRVSFQQNGDVFRIPPVAPGTANGYPIEDLTGQIDKDIDGAIGGSNSLIIKDRITDTANDFTFQLPNVECDNCTVQVIQMMTDKPPYTTAVDSDDIYFACVDLVLSAAAPEVPIDPGPGPGATMPDAGTSSNPAGGNDSNISGGCSAVDGPSALLMFALIGLMRRGRRIRRS